MKRIKFWVVACSIASPFAAPLAESAEPMFYYDPKNCRQAQSSLKSIQERFQMRQESFSRCLKEGKGRWNCDSEAHILTVIMDQYPEVSRHINRLCPRGRRKD